VINDPSLDVFFLAKVDNGIAAVSIGTPLTVTDNAVIDQVNRAIRNTRNAGNSGFAKRQILTLFKYRDKAILHFRRPIDFKRFRPAFYAVFRVRGNLKRAACLVAVLGEASKIESVGRRCADKLSGSVGIYAMNAVHKRVVRFLPVDSCFHGFIGRINHFVQRDAGSSRRSRIVSGKRHASDIERIVGDACWRV